MRKTALVLALLLDGAAHAETAQAPAPAPELAPAQKPSASFGAEHPDCLEWTDGCIVCRKQSDGTTGCSTPGIACLPVEPTCSRRLSAPSPTPQ